MCRKLICCHHQKGIHSMSWLSHIIIHIIGIIYQVDLLCGLDWGNYSHQHKTSLVIVMMIITIINIMSIIWYLAVETLVSSIAPPQTLDQSCCGRDLPVCIIFTFLQSTLAYDIKKIIKKSHNSGFTGLYMYAHYLLKCFCLCFCWTFRAKPDPKIPWNISSHQNI